MYTDRKKRLIHLLWVWEFCTNRTKLIHPPNSNLPFYGRFAAKEHSLFAANNYVGGSTCYECQSIQDPRWS